MKLTFMTDAGESFVVEIDSDMELENVMALLEAEVCLPCMRLMLSNLGRTVRCTDSRTEHLFRRTGTQ